ncbi:hypothetical protein HY468_05590 [Candidatus Roizmanbacteria bacterium]|nr:hypothetical protein [Candidatus Roizmanbacteria bacterium]
MRKTGRGSAYRKALVKNLIRTLNTQKKLTTSKAKAEQIMRLAQKGGRVISVQTLGTQRGDMSKQVLLQLREEKEKSTHENGTNQTKRRPTNVASR